MNHDEPSVNGLNFGLMMGQFHPSQNRLCEFSHLIMERFRTPILLLQISIG